MRSSTDTRTRLKRTSYLPRGLWNRVFYLAPVAFVLLYGAAWIALHAQQARGFVHPLYQSLALVENVIALLLRRREPIGALAGILVVHTLVDLEPITLVPVLLSLFTVTVVSTRWVTVWAIVATTLLVMAKPLIHGDSIDLFVYSCLHLTAIGLVAAAGLYWRSRQKMALLKIREKVHA
jgi:hypothetical protein